MYRQSMDQDIYNFIYKGKSEAVLTEVQRVPGEFSYFLQSDREMIGEVMEQVENGFSYTVMQYIHSADDSIAI